MGRQPLGRFGRIDRTAMRAEADADLRAASASRIDPDRLAEGLSIADQQIIEIAKAISLDARVLIMDEPTAALSGRRGRAALRRRPQPARRGPRAPVHLAPLRRGLRALRHRHGHARRLLRRHRRPIADTTVDELVRRWSAATSPSCSPSCRPTIGEVVLVVEGLTAAGRLPRHLLHRARRRDRRPGRARRRRPQRGRPRDLRHRPLRRRRGARCSGRPLPKGSPTAAMAPGIALVPEDRRQQGLVIDESRRAQRRRSPSAASSPSAGLIWRRGRERAPPGVGRAGSRSRRPRSTPRPARCRGGNQQKVVLGQVAGHRARRC